MAPLLLFSVFVVSTCGLIYELITGALASYLLGDSITQFSTVIGVYLFSMGIGSFFSRYIQGNLKTFFIQVEILIGLIGGFSAALLFLSFEFVSEFRILLYLMVLIIGSLVGIEIPILLRILKSQYEFKDLVSKVFTFDYIGALIASILFPLLLVPHLGLIKTSFFFGILNVLVALLALYLFKDISWSRSLKILSFISLLFLGLGFIFSDKITNLSEVAHYPEPVIFSKATPYQRIVLTKSKRDLKLFLNGNLQFSAKDEYRYHETLVHVGLASLKEPKKILVLGGGDGLAVREIFKYPSVTSVTLVDLDPAMTKLFSQTDFLAKLNGSSLNDPRITIINEDAFSWLKKTLLEKKNSFDFIAVDFPDPSNFSIGKLYSTTFYRLLTQVLSTEGLMVIQSTSPFVAIKSFSCVINTLKSVGLLTTPYHVFVPSFGEWGFVLAGKKPFNAAQNYPSHLKFITSATVTSLFEFPPDMTPVPTEANRLNNQVLVRYFEDEWSSVQ